MKKFLVFLIMLMAAVLLTCALAEEDQPQYTSGDYEYILLEDGTAEITRYKGRDKKLTVPAELDGHQVSVIGDSAFSACRSLTSITLPDSLSAIGDDAFYNCTSLTSITLPDSLTVIGDFAFYFCNSLTSITLPDSLSAIGYKAFNKCKSLKTVTVPRNSYAAQYCKENGLPYTYPDANDWLLN